MLQYVAILSGSQYSRPEPQIGPYAAFGEWDIHLAGSAFAAV